MDSSGVMYSGSAGNAGAESADLVASGVARDEADRNPIFEALVKSDGEISGLVAYSIYKQNKRDWLEDFKKQTGRLPTDAETRAYIIGESTVRRLAIYRQLAQTTLGQQQPIRGVGPASNRASPLAVALWALAIVIALGLIGYGLRSLGVLGSK